MITKNLDTGTILFVEVPLNATRFQLTKEDGFTMFLAMNENGKPLTRTDIVLGNWEILFPSTEPDESTLSELIETTVMYKIHEVAVYKYRSYKDGFIGFRTATEAYQSLKVSLCVVDSNKYDGKEDSTNLREDVLEQSLVKKYIVLFERKTDNNVKEINNS